MNNGIPSPCDVCTKRIGDDCKKGYHKCKEFRDWVRTSWNWMTAEQHMQKQKEKEAEVKKTNLRLRQIRWVYEIEKMNRLVDKGN